ncbi:hypothetical protein Esti_002010 [Eimeria stiedai]
MIRRKYACEQMASYVKRVSAEKSALRAAEPKGFCSGKKKDIVGDKVPQTLSLRGSNSLRGGCKTFNAMCLNGNWFEDRLNPDVQKELELFTASDNVPGHAQFGAWASEYTVAYSKGNWAHEKSKIAPSTILAFDDSGPSEWTSSYRHDYKNRHAEQAAALRKCAEEKAKRIEDVRRRLSRAEEERKPEWPLTRSQLNARVSSGREPQCQRRPSEELDPQMREREERDQEERQEENNDYNDFHEFHRGRLDLAEEVATPGSRHSYNHGEHAHHHHHHHVPRSYSGEGCGENEDADDLNKRMENHRLSQLAQLPRAGIPSDRVRFADGWGCCRH